MGKQYDIIVVGGGHAGIEASFSAAKMGCSVLLLTLNRENIGKLSCNPAVGGVAKGHLVREVDALGGLIGKIADATAVSYRWLNKSKGKAVWATRVQVDRFKYPKIAQVYLQRQSNLDILEAKVVKILVRKKVTYGVETNLGQRFLGKVVIICAGTFLKSTIHIGLNNFSGGRLYELSSDELFDDIKSLGFKTKHFKTGTCARLDKRSIDFSQLEEQPPHYDVEPFSFTNDSIPCSALSCFIGYTNEKTRKVILKNLKYSPLYTGIIKARGVRYCPSLEDKIVKFPDKEKHHIFIEPEGWDSCEVYPNGLSTSLPFEIQEEFIHTIKGLEHAKITRPGYGIEHGLISPQQLIPTLETKLIENLYFAGQVNGTTGYEEAAAQGIIAGINAALKIKKKKHFILRREEAFIGVLIDDLTRKGVDEPYRMFTSRSEYRLSLRESNADLRLGAYAYKLGLITSEEYDKIRDKKDKIEELLKKLNSTKVLFEGKKVFLSNILKRPDKELKDLKKLGIEIDTLSLRAEKEVEIIIKYEGFLKREEQSLKMLSKLNKVKIPEDLDFERVPFLSREIRDKLKLYKPKNLEEALKISGVTPAAVIGLYRLLDS